MRVGVVVLSLAVLSGAWTPLHAQAPDGLAAARRVGAALARLRPGQAVRVQAQGLGRVEGMVDSSSLQTVLALRSKGSRFDVPASAIDTLWVRGTHAVRGAAIGGALTGIGLGVFAAALSSGLCESASGCNATGAFFGGMLIGGTAGCVIGGIIGSGFTSWRRWI